MITFKSHFSISLLLLGIVTVCAIWVEVHEQNQTSFAINQSINQVVPSFEHHITTPILVESEIETVEFEYQNRTQNSVKVERIYTSCGCTTAYLQKETLLPNEKTTYVIKIRTQGRNGPQKIESSIVFENEYPTPCQTRAS